MNFLYFRHFFQNPVVKRDCSQTLPCMLKLVNGCNLFIVYCSIPYIILQVEIILHRCQNWHFVPQTHLKSSESHSKVFVYVLSPISLERTNAGEFIWNENNMVPRLQGSSTYIDLTNRWTEWSSPYLCFF